jgi:hypothetical protein
MGKNFLNISVLLPSSSDLEVRVYARINGGKKKGGKKGEAVRENRGESKESRAGSGIFKATDRTFLILSFLYFH